MAQHDPQTIRDLYSAFARGDAATVFANFEPDIVWNEAESSPYADRNPYVGPQQVGDGVFGRLLADFNGFTVIADKIVHDGDTVVALGRYHGVYRSTDQVLDAQFVHVWTFRNGKIASFQQYADTAQFLRVAGLPVIAP
jgi:uncharacterized protein